MSESQLTVEQLQSLQRDALEASQAASKLGAFIEMFTRVKTVLETAGRIAHAQLAWNEEQRTRILGEHTAAAEQEARSIVESAHAQAHDIVSAAEVQAAAKLEESTRVGKQEIESQKALLRGLKSERAALTTEIEGAKAQLKVLEERNSTERAKLRAAG